MAEPSRNYSLHQLRKLPASELNATDECPVCFDAVPNLVTSCGHTFCRSCIVDWLKLRSNTCPMCQHELYEKAEAQPEGIENATADAPLPRLDEVARSPLRVRNADRRATSVHLSNLSRGEHGANRVQFQEGTYIYVLYPDICAAAAAALIYKRREADERGQDFGQQWQLIANEISEVLYHFADTILRGRELYAELQAAISKQDTVLELSHEGGTPGSDLSTDVHWICGYITQSAQDAYQAWWPARLETQSDRVEHQTARRQGKDMLKMRKASRSS